MSGNVNLGGLVGSMSGSVVGGIRTLRGTATGEGFTAIVTEWSTTTSGNTMTGTVNHDLTFGGVPGVAAIRSSLSDVTRQTTPTRTNTVKAVPRARAAR